MSSPSEQGSAEIAARLEELRAVLRSESMSYGELAELQGLAPHIAPGDVELLEAAGVPEFPEDEPLPNDAPVGAVVWANVRRALDAIVRLEDGEAAAGELREALALGEASVTVSREDAGFLADLCSAELNAVPDDWDDGEGQARLERLEVELRGAVV